MLRKCAKLFCLILLTIVAFSNVALAENEEKLLVLMTHSCSSDRSIKECMEQAVSDIGETPRGAVKMISAECEANNFEACSFLGYLNESGLLMQRNIEKAIPFYERACENDIGSGCTRLGWQVLKKGDIEKAQMLTEKGCQFGFPEGCNQLAVMFGLPVERQIELMEQGCDGGSSSACYNLAGRYQRGDGLPANEALAAKYYARSAELGGPAE